MKKFFKVTVLLTLLLLRFPAAAEEKPTVILNLEEKPQSRPVSLEETVTRFLDSAKYFEQKYPGELIDGDIHEDIAIPNLRRRKFTTISSICAAE